MNFEELATALIQLPQTQRDRLCAALDGEVPSGFIGDKIKEIAPRFPSIGMAWISRQDLLMAYVQEEPSAPAPKSASVPTAALPALPPIPPPAAFKTSTAKSAPAKKKGEDDDT